MVHLCSDGEEDCQHDHAMPCRLNNNAEWGQDDHSGFTVSELKMAFEKMCIKLPFLLDVKQESDNQRSQIKSCPCGNKSAIPNYISFVNPHKDSPKPEHCIGSENEASDSLSIFYRTASLFSIPVNLRPSRFSFESEKNQRGRRSINNAGDFIVESSPTAASGDGILTRSGRWMFDSIEANGKARALLKSSLLFRFGVLEGKRSHFKSASNDTRLIKSSELCSSPSVLRKTIGRRSSELNITERKLASCSSTNSTCSYLSTSSSNSLSEGMLYCVWKSGVPYFVLSLDNDRDVYVANPQKVESSVDKALDYVYLFCSRSSRDHRNSASGVVGKMKVSSSLVLNSNRSILMETEFVLFGRREEYFKEIESTPSTLTKNKGLSKVAEIFQSSSKFKHKAIHKFGEPSFQFDDFMQEMFAGELRDLNELDNVNHFVQDFQPNLELAAIVVKDYQSNRNREAATGGWGLKFLEKVQVSDADNSEVPSFSCKSFEDLKRNCEDHARKMDVLIPAGFHGGPITRTGGAASLTERWQSGGYCDCGGWDLGCPLTLLNNNCSGTLIPDESEEDRQPVCLFMEGAQHGEPTLRMVNKSKGLYLINFQSSLSALQSFSIAVASIHSRTPDLYPKL